MVNDGDALQITTQRPHATHKATAFMALFLIVRDVFEMKRFNFRMGYDETKNIIVLGLYSQGFAPPPPLGLFNPSFLLFSLSPLETG